MKRRNSAVAIVVSVLVIIIGGMTAINWHWKESWKLFWYDLRNGFFGFGWLYPSALAAVFVLAALWSFVVYWILVRKKRYRYVAVYNFVCLFLLALCIVFNVKNAAASRTKCIWEPTKTIGHSFGVVNGDTYTGSWEAFEENYARGRRVMEVDILLTSDNKCVLKHEWDVPVQEGISEENVPDEETFLNTKLDGKYTPMSFEQLCGLMIKYPDLWVVTDTKYTQEDEIREQFEIMMETIKNTEGGHSEILDRFIVQVYNEQMYEFLQSQYGFKTYIFTMYKRFYTNDTVGIFRDVCRYCVNHGIEVVMLKHRRYDNYSEEIQKIADEYGLKLYIHTVNDLDAAEELLDAGVAGICTDEIYDSDL